MPSRLGRLGPLNAPQVRPVLDSASAGPACHLRPAALTAESGHYHLCAAVHWSKQDGRLLLVAQSA